MPGHDGTDPHARAEPGAREPLPLPLVVIVGAVAVGALFLWLDSGVTFRRASVEVRFAGCVLGAATGALAGAGAVVYRACAGSAGGWLLGAAFLTMLAGMAWGTWAQDTKLWYQAIGIGSFAVVCGAASAAAILRCTRDADDGG